MKRCETIKKLYPHVLQAGGHWFEPSIAHPVLSRLSADLLGAFFFSGSTWCQQMGDFWGVFFGRFHFVSFLFLKEKTVHYYLPKSVHICFLVAVIDNKVNLSVNTDILLVIRLTKVNTS